MTAEASTHPRRATGRARGLIKICGLTAVEDAAAAARAGAGALGFIFAPSRRQLSLEQAADLTGALAERFEAGEWSEAPLQVGVFQDAGVDQMIAAASAARLDMLQLHGDEPATMAPALRAAGVAVWKTIPMIAGESGEEARARMLAWAPWVDAFLLDTATATHRGGSGMTFDWHRVPELAAFLGGATGREIPLLVAGGLRPENVEEAIRTSGAWGVDVCSGVEASPGRKDGERVRWLVQAARSAFGLPPASPHSDAQPAMDAS